MIYSRVTKVKTRSGSEILVKEHDLEIRSNMNNKIVIQLTVLSFPLHIVGVLDHLDYNFKDHPKESTEYFHRDEIVWFKNQWL